MACILKVPKSYPLFKQCVQFVVNTLSESIMISIRGITSMPKLISGFLIFFKNLINLQQLYILFSWADYLTFKKPLFSILAKQKIDKL